LDSPRAAATLFVSLIPLLWSRLHRASSRVTVWALGLLILPRPKQDEHRPYGVVGTVLSAPGFRIAARSARTGRS
jgi:hypothetical protein